MEQKNLILAIALSAAILLGFQLFFAPPPPPPSQTDQTATTSDGDQIPQASIPGTDSTTGAAVASNLSRQEIIDQAPHIPIKSSTLEGSISLVGGKVNNLILKKYRETIDPDSPHITLLSPNGAPHPYYADFGWTGNEGDMAKPQADTLWTTDGQELSPGIPLTLSWDNGSGLVFQRIFELDENYMFTVTQRIVNNSDRAVTLSPYGLISRTGTPEVLGFYILHEGLIGVLDDKLVEIDYDDLQDTGSESQATTGGWIGITDKYWLVALIPNQEQTVDTRFIYNGKSGVAKYQTDILYQGVTVPAGGQTNVTSRLFAGAKEVVLLDDYEETLGIKRFDLAVDFGWFYFLTKPLFYALHWLADLTGNFGVAILLLTVAIKIVFFPLANKSYRSMAAMRKLQPKMMELRERFGDDKQRLNQEMMALYKREGANPLSGCLPILVQIPVFFALYKVMFVTIEMRQAPFFGWIHDLSAPDPTSILNGFGLLPWGVPQLGLFDLLNIGVWPLAMGITMYLQQKLNPQPPDPMQAKIFLMLPIVFTFLLAQFPAGLVIYWTWNNLLSILQQAVIMKRAGVPIGRQPTTTTPSS
ncbi:MAG: membrane protein insertase YidC [Pseudomonadota bacterium]